MTDRFIVARLTLEGDKFEIIVKPDPALEYKLGKRADLSGALVSDEIYSDANKGSRASSEKMMKHFKTTDAAEVAKQILARGELNLTTDQRRKMVEEKKKQIVQFINKSFVDPKTHLPHPVMRIEAAMEESRVIDRHVLHDLGEVKGYFHDALAGLDLADVIDELGVAHTGVLHQLRQRLAGEGGVAQTLVEADHRGILGQRHDLDDLVAVNTTINNGHHGVVALAHGARFGMATTDVTQASLHCTKPRRDWNRRRSSTRR